MKRIVIPAVLVMFGLLYPVQHGWAAEAPTDTQTDYLLLGESTDKDIILHSYSSLPELVSLICEDAINQFYDFYGSNDILVEPFTLISESKTGKVSMLGLSLADQMTARINNDSVTRFTIEPDQENQHQQWLRGMLQELDGYLRIHISGANANGERRSYVVNVEMSEPIYRALHTDVGAYTAY